MEAFARRTTAVHTAGRAAWRGCRQQKRVVAGAAGWGDTLSEDTVPLATAAKVDVAWAVVPVGNRTHAPWTSPGRGARRVRHPAVRCWSIRGAVAPAEC